MKEIKLIKLVIFCDSKCKYSKEAKYPVHFGIGNICTQEVAVHIDIAGLCSEFEPQGEKND